MTHRNLIALAAPMVAVLCLACATKPYRHQELDTVPFQTRAQGASEGGLRVRVAVPGADESEAIFGVPVYDRGIQPVWIEITNGTDTLVRFPPVGLDPDYFSPLEVPYMFRGGYSKEARAEMDRRFARLAISRRIPAGRTISGFVFTNLSPGTKAIRIDLYGDGGQDASFIFFTDVPGFVPDHADVDFEGLYEPGEIADYDVEGLRRALADLPCCTTDRTGEREGLPFNVVLVGDGEEVLHALLRARWYETRPERKSGSPDSGHHFFGRTPDAVFRRLRKGPGGAAGDSERNEMSLWLAPMRAAGEQVWIAQVKHYIGRPTRIEQMLVGSRLGPSVDEGGYYLLQLSWYAQSLRKYGWLDGGRVAPIEAPASDFNGSSYFSDGKRAVLWLSGDPISIFDIGYVDWDPEPGE